LTVSTALADKTINVVNINVMERKRVLRKVQITVTTNYDFSPGRIRKIMQGTRY
jgi:hypothetical protein